MTIVYGSGARGFIGSDVLGLINKFHGDIRVVSAYNSVQETIDSLPESGGSIYLPPGIYEESIIINKPNVHLTGTWDSILQTPDDASNEEAATVRVLADNCIIDNIQIDGNGDNNPQFDSHSDSRYADGIAIYADHVRINKCYIHDMLGHGIIVWNEEYASENISAGPRSDIVISENSVQNLSWRAGIDIASTDTNVDVSNNISIANNIVSEMRDNTITDYGTGITLHTANDVTIQGNKIFNVNGHGMALHTTVFRTVCSNNNISNVNGSGIYTVAFEDGVIQANTINICGEEGILLDRPKYSQCVNNFIKEATDSGILLLLGASSNVIDNNYIVDISGDSIAINDISTRSFGFNRILNNRTDGVTIGIIIESGQNEIRDNFITATGAGSKGIVSKEDNHRFFANRFRGMETGMEFLEDPVDIEIRNNYFDTVSGDSITGAYTGITENNRGV